MPELSSIRETCTPREDVLQGGLLDKHFAAQLDQVIRNADGYETYSDAESFFSLTYPTAGLQALLADGRALASVRGIIGKAER